MICQQQLEQNFDRKSNFKYQKHNHNQSFTNNINLARSIPSNMQYLISAQHQQLPLESLIKKNSSFNSFTNTKHHLIHSKLAPISSNISLNQIDSNNNKGILNTLRRSLKKNKVRFYNKQSSIFKSYNSINDASSEQQSTPSMNRRQHYENENLRSYQPSFTIEVSNDHGDNILPLQLPLGNDRIGERTRGIQSNQCLPLRTSLNGSSPLVPNHHYNGSVPKASSPLPVVPTVPLTPIPTVSSTTNSNGIIPNTKYNNSLVNTNNNNNSNTSIVETENDAEKEKLKNDLQLLRSELQKSKETIARLQKSEEQMRERLAEQAQRQIEKGGKFEDLNQLTRPTELIRSYNALYSQARIDALDALDSVSEMSDAEDLKSKLLFSVVVLAFRHAQIQAKEIRLKVKQILQLTSDKSSTLLVETIEKYLKSTIQKYDVVKLAYEVENQLWTTLYDYPALKCCNELIKYIMQSCRIAWGLVNHQFLIEFQSTKYDRLLHERFHTSDNESETIIEYIWPCLIDGRDRTCVAKGVVITDDRYSSNITS
ncbi:unnamed protein product [Didymodactylos carnosus]|uniref:Mitochondria-eating protein n=2 Tax=Didymodactylos carnosus TaxID=1234261 RepID=A0A813QCN9_9BILA|nr:unnamed protein product [Didymodactylos carnosus]CAF3546728.1 unnamed protein product [Didymodactylos carnosus]